MKFTKILVLGIAEEQLDAASWRTIRTLTGNCVVLPSNSPDIEAHLRNTDCLLVNIKTDKSMINKAPHLKYIGALNMLIGNKDLSYAKGKKIVVTNVPGYTVENGNKSGEISVTEQITFVGNIQNFLQKKPTNIVKLTSKS